MTWATFYLICFVIGLVFSFLSVVGGLHRLRLPGHLHLPHFLGHPIGAKPWAWVHFHGINAAHGVRLGSMHRVGTGARGGQVSVFNFSSLMAFLAWFGGSGYLLTRYSTIWTAAAFAIALVCGLVAATLVFLFLIKVLLAHETELDPADFDRVGVLGKVSVRIRKGGTGEILFSQGGTRHAAGARSADGKPIASGTEVIIIRYEKGIAYVRSYDEMVGELRAPDEATEASGS